MEDNLCRGCDVFFNHPPVEGVYSPHLHSVFTQGSCYNCVVLSSPVHSESLSAAEEGSCVSSLQQGVMGWRDVFLHSTRNEQAKRSSGLTNDLITSSCAVK